MSEQRHQVCWKLKAAYGQLDFCLQDWARNRFGDRSCSYKRRRSWLSLVMEVTFEEEFPDFDVRLSPQLRKQFYEKLKHLVVVIDTKLEDGTKNGIWDGRYTLEEEDEEMDFAIHMSVLEKFWKENVSEPQESVSEHLSKPQENVSEPQPPKKGKEARQKSKEETWSGQLLMDMESPVGVGS